MDAGRTTERQRQERESRSRKRDIKRLQTLLQEREGKITEMESTLTNLREELNLSEKNVQELKKLKYHDVCRFLEMNPKQKIWFHVKVKEQNDKLKEENKRLKLQVQKLSESPAKQQDASTASAMDSE